MALKVSKSFKNVINSQEKSGKPLAESKVLSHKDFGPYIETVARNSPEWGQLKQHEWVFTNADAGGGNVNVYFRHVGDGTSRGLSFAEARVMEELYKTEVDEPETESKDAKKQGN